MSPPRKRQLTTEEKKAWFLHALFVFGGRLSNRFLQDELEMSEDEYRRIKQILIEEGKIATGGGGGGGTVRLIDPEAFLAGWSSENHSFGA